LRGRTQVGDRLVGISLLGSGLWCQMAECGNRAEASAYRTRQVSAMGR
jgi:hypothetical protein